MKLFCNFAKLTSPNVVNLMNTPVETRKEYSSIHCLKALGAFFVVCIHTCRTIETEALIRTAVPLFFMITGFFLYNEDGNIARKNLKKSLKRIFWLTVYANVFYYMVFFLPHDICPLKNWRDVERLIIFGDFFETHLWFLTAYVEVVVLILFAYKFRFLKLLWCMIPIFLALGLLLGKYSIFLPEGSEGLLRSRNFLTIGLPCFAVGWFLHKYQQQFLKAFPYPLLILVALILLSYGEEYWLSWLSGQEILLGDLLITTLPISFMLMLLGVKHQDWGKGTFFEKIGKKYSTGIYVYHMFILYFLSIISEKYFEINSILMSFVCYAVTLGFVMVWDFLSYKVFLRNIGR